MFGRGLDITAIYFFHLLLLLLLLLLASPFLFIFLSDNLSLTFDIYWYSHVQHTLLLFRFHFYQNTFNNDGPEGFSPMKIKNKTLQISRYSQQKKQTLTTTVSHLPYRHFFVWILLVYLLIYSYYYQISFFFPISFSLSQYVFLSRYFVILSLVFSSFTSTWLSITSLLADVKFAITHRQFI